MTSSLRVLADVLIAKAAEAGGDTARHLQDAAASILDADTTAERDGLQTMFTFPEN